MSYNDNNPQRAARRHRPALIGIAVALLVALLAFVVFRPGMNEQNDGIATTPPPAQTPLTSAEGTDGSTSPTISPEGTPQMGAGESTDAGPAADGEAADQ